VELALPARRRLTRDPVDRTSRACHIRHIASVYLSIVPEFAGEGAYDRQVGPLYDEIVASLREAGHRLVNAWGWENAVSGANVALARRVESIRRADVVVLLVGLLHPPDKALGASNLVEAEYRAARDAGKPCVAVLEPEWKPEGMGQALLAGAAMIWGKAELARRFRRELVETIPTVVADPRDRLAVVSAVHEALALAEAPAAAAPPSAQRRDGVFVSYSHKDRKWLTLLQTHLKPYVRSGIRVWDKTKIAPGSRWREEIESALSTASVAVLLVSPNFLASDFIDEQEMPRILHAAENEGLVVLWIPVEESAYTKTWIRHVHAAHSPGRPLATLRAPVRNQALVAIAKHIGDVASTIARP
jgi:hypothetical protein